MTGADVFMLGIGFIFLVIFMFVVGVLVGRDGRAVTRLQDQPHRLPRPLYRHPSRHFFRHAPRRFVTRQLPPTGAEGSEGIR